jgi:hypothetical protein
MNVVGTDPASIPCAVARAMNKGMVRAFAHHLVLADTQVGVALFELPQERLLVIAVGTTDSPEDMHLRRGGAVFRTQCRGGGEREDEGQKKL